MQSELQEWIGKTETRSDQITSAPVAALSATLDRNDPYPQAGDSLPPLSHWLYFLPIHREAEIGHDGLPLRGGFLPPVELPRRMWAGTRLELIRPLRIGETYVRTSRVLDVKQKTGRHGPLVFVVVRHEISAGTDIALIDEHDIVYRGKPLPGGTGPVPQLAPERAAWERQILPDEVLLFRYSALTFNGHRIHYDKSYAEQEGYPGLVVHGPLIATLLADLLRRNLPELKIVRFAFRAIAPLFCGLPFMLCGKPSAEGTTVSLWATDHSGALAMTATAILA